MRTEIAAQAVSEVRWVHVCVPAVEVGAIEVSLVGSDLLAEETDGRRALAAQLATEAGARQDERSLVADHGQHRPLPHVEVEVPMAAAYLQNIDDNGHSSVHVYAQAERHGE